MLKRFPVLTFFILAFAISWIAVMILQWAAVQSGLADFSDLMAVAETTFHFSEISPNLVLPFPIIYLLTRIVDFGPSIAGLLTPFVIGHPQIAKKIFQRLVDFRFRWHWYAWSLLLPLGIVLGAFVLHLVIGDSAVDIANLLHLKLPYLIGQLVFWVFIMRTLLGGGLGEELGWRGFALPRLAERHSLLRASLIIGLVWTFWHLPGHLVSSSPLVNFIAQLLFTVPLSFLFTWLYYRTEERLLPVVLAHGALNGLNAYFERALFPPLIDEDGFVIFFILVVLITGIFAIFQVRKLDTKINVYQPGG